MNQERKNLILAAVLLYARFNLHELNEALEAVDEIGLPTHEYWWNKVYFRREKMTGKVEYWNGRQWVAQEHQKPAG